MYNASEQINQHKERKKNEIDKKSLKHAKEHPLTNPKGNTDNNQTNN